MEAFSKPITIFLAQMSGDSDTLEDTICADGESLSAVE